MAVDGFAYYTQNFENRKNVEPVKKLQDLSPKHLGKNQTTSSVRTTVDRAMTNSDVPVSVRDANRQSIATSSRSVDYLTTKVLEQLARGSQSQLVKLTLKGTNGAGVEAQRSALISTTNGTHNADVIAPVLDQTFYDAVSAATGISLVPGLGEMKLNNVATQFNAVKEIINKVFTPAEQGTIAIKDLSDKLKEKGEYPVITGDLEAVISPLIEIGLSQLPTLRAIEFEVLESVGAEQSAQPSLEQRRANALAAIARRQAANEQASTSQTTASATETPEATGGAATSAAPSSLDTHSETDSSSEESEDDDDSVRAETPAATIPQSGVQLAVVEELAGAQASAGTVDEDLVENAVAMLMSLDIDQEDAFKSQLAGYSAETLKKVSATFLSLGDDARGNAVSRIITHNSEVVASSVSDTLSESRAVTSEQRVQRAIQSIRNSFNPFEDIPSILTGLSFEEKLQVSGALSEISGMQYLSDAVQNIISSDFF